MLHVDTLRIIITFVIVIFITEDSFFLLFAGWNLNGGDWIHKIGSISGGFQNI